MEIMSWLLSAIGIFGYWLLAEKDNKWGWIVGVTYNILWIFYALATHQLGFIAVCVFFVVVNARGFYKRSKK
jgi:hypothetical protein